MGRPNRKRPRETEQVTPIGKPPPPLDRNPSYPFGECPNSGLQSLVIGGAALGTSKATGGTAVAGRKTIPTPALVRGLWGGVREADIAAPSSTLGVGVDADADGAGVSWLVNPSVHEHAADVAKTKAAPLPPETQGCYQCAPDQNVSAGDTGAFVACQDSPPAASRPGCGEREDEAQAAAAPSSTPFHACEASLRERLSRVKGGFGEIPPVVFKRARSACNPAEALGSGSFLNRSAMKLANIDAVLGEQLSLPSRPSADGGQAEGKTLPEGACIRESLREGESPSALLFADLCGGPGGFSEYLLRRRRRQGLSARGWGISLRAGGARVGVSGGNPDVVEDTAAIRGRDGSMAAAAEDETPARRATGSVAKGGLSDKESEAREETSRDGHRRTEEDDEGDPCAWRLDHLRPWCNVSSAAAAGRISAAASTPNGTTVSAAAAAAVGGAGTAQLLEMRIDYGPKGTGDVTDEENLQGFVESVLASVG
ncbi:unnamed protein product, partial [Hapterophycus canaliculatus]